MTLYLDVAADLAQQVDAGVLAAGTELPSVRELARAHRTTVSTASRAYRHLAEAGVIAMGDRRRGRVSRDGALEARRMLGAAEVFRLAGSDDPALDLLLRRIGPAVAPGAARGSFAGLTALSRGEADGAAIHLRHASGRYNAPFASALLRGRQPTLVHLWRREQGLLVPTGNPLGILAASGLRGRRVARREFGSGTRALLERELAAAGIEPERVPGPEAGSHLEVALAVAAGMADAGLAVRAAAAETGLDFVPVVWEEFDVVLPGSALGAAAPLITALHDEDLRAALGALGGYDLTDAGTVQALA